ncbi:MAG TPA: hypothetical protein VFO11_04475 [Candidatus Polarisedimenticolaceae bacterium]|nr:hypothetical protein [Candidatus Polarisedimenticolaceae bacterium]
MRVVLWALTLSLLAIPAAQADTFSKKYRFVLDKTLEMGETLGDGMRLDSVQFVMPATDGKILRIGGVPEAVVAISNMSQESVKVGIAVAVFDEEGRLLGVASGGSAMRGIRALRQVGYSLKFDWVNGEMTKAATFQVSVETKP